MKILRDWQWREVVDVLEKSQEVIAELQAVLEAKDALLKTCAGEIAILQDAVLNEKRMHMSVAAASSAALTSDVDITEELDAIALELQGEIARLEEWYVSDGS